MPRRGGIYFSGPQRSSANSRTEAHMFCDAYHEQQIDNSATVLEKIASLYADRLLSDITLEVGGKMFAAHRLILCASSDVFQVMLMNPIWSESHESRIVLKEDPSCVEVFPDFLKYLYTGKLHINHLLVLPLVMLADKYNVKDLIRLCVDYMCKHVVSASKHNLLVPWLQYTLTCGHQAVCMACSNFITWNFELVAAMDEFVNLEEEVLISFLCKSDLVLKDELTLFHCVAKWLSHHELRLQMTNEQRRTQIFNNSVIDVMSHIRFPMMTPCQLATLLIHPLTSRFKDFFVDLMSLAMAYHCNQDGGRVSFALQTEKGRALFTPRLYTAETWSASLVIDNYSNLFSYSVRTLVFNTPASFADCNSDRTYEWMVDVYPKGVWFKKFYLIVWQGTLEMPEFVSKTVRLSLTSKDSKDVARVTVGILISGKQDGMEHVRTVVKRNFVFTDEERMMNINDLVPYDELNDIRMERSAYMVGNSSDELKLQIVITPFCIM